MPAVRMLWLAKFRGFFLACDRVRRGFDAFVLRRSIVAHGADAALRAVMLANPSGERIALVGPSGCGKTWLALELATRG